MTPGLASIIATLSLGLVLLLLFGVWDLRYAPRPVIAPRFVRNRSVVFASCVGFFDFVSLGPSVLLSSPLFSFAHCPP